MAYPSPGEVLNECERIGLHAVEAKLKQGLFLDYQAVAWEWFLKKQSEIAKAQENELREREIEGLRQTRRIASATWWLAGATIALAFVTIIIGLLATKDAEESRRQQSEDAKAQVEVQKELVQVQVSIELDKQFDSLEMRRARRRLATQLLENKKVTEERVVDFFETLGMYMHKGHIDEDTVYNDYSGMIEGYWPVLRQFIMDSRKEDKAPDEYGHFEKLYSEMIARDKDPTPELSKKELHDFLLDEKNLAP